MWMDLCGRVPDALNNVVSMKATFGPILDRLRRHMQQHSLGLDTPPDRWGTGAAESTPQKVAILLMFAIGRQHICLYFRRSTGGRWTSGIRRQWRRERRGRWRQWRRQWRGRRWQWRRQQWLGTEVQQEQLLRRRVLSARCPHVPIE